MQKKLMRLENISAEDKKRVSPFKGIRSLASSLNNFFKFSLYHEKIESIELRENTDSGYIYNIEIEIDLLSFTSGKQQLPEFFETIEQLHNLIKKIPEATTQFEMDACLQEKIKEVIDKTTIKNEIIKAIHNKVYQVKNKFFSKLSSLEENTDLMSSYIKEEIIKEFHLEKEYISINIFSGLFNIDIQHFIKVFALYEINYCKGREMLENDIHYLLAQKNARKPHKKHQEKHLIQMLIEQYPDSESHFIEAKTAENTSKGNAVYQSNARHQRAL